MSIVGLVDTAVSRSCWMTLKTTKTAGWTSLHVAMRGLASMHDQTGASTVTSGVPELRPSTFAANSVSHLTY